MKILRVHHKIDTPLRYNYGVNYGVLDQIDSFRIMMSSLHEVKNEWIESFDVVFLPMYKRWDGYEDQIDRLKAMNVKTVLFDNDSCYRSFDHPFYHGIDFVFYRVEDRDGNAPIQPSHKLLWSIDTDKFTPVYGGSGVSFNCTVNHDTYRLRKDIAKHITPTNHTGKNYIRHLQGAAAAIHTNSQIAPMPRAKILEFAACGTQIISNRMDGISDYFPEGLVMYFDTVPELLKIVHDFVPNVKIQKELRNIVEERHSDQQRATELIQTLRTQF